MTQKTKIFSIFLATFSVFSMAIGEIRFHMADDPFVLTPPLKVKLIETSAGPGYESERDESTEKIVSAHQDENGFVILTFESGKSIPLGAVPGLTSFSRKPPKLPTREKGIAPTVRNFYLRLGELAKARKELTFTDSEIIMPTQNSALSYPDTCSWKDDDKTILLHITNLPGALRY